MPPRSTRHTSLLWAFLMAVASVVRADGGRVVKGMSFTPGPWQWWDRYGYGRGVEGELHAGVREEHDFSSEDACAVVLVAAGYEADGVVASYADAALIAAAPDMFMALDQIETWAEQIEPLTGKSIGYIGLILARCRDALAKAAPESAKQEER